jgi:hypothetical protein
VSQRAGPWRLRGERACFEVLRPRLVAAARRAERWRGFVELAAEGAPARRAFLKYGPLRAWPALRHRARTLVPRIEIPRLQEHANLAWLREHGFGAPRPLVAGVLVRLCLPRFQFLVSEEAPGTRTLAEVLADPDDAQRTAALELLARDAARLHAFGFTHRDLFARNLLVAGADPAALRLLFLDAWRGGPRRGLRGAEYDLACFLLDAGARLAPPERERFLALYSAERGLSAARASALRAAVAREGERLARRLARRGRISAS